MPTPFTTTLHVAGSEVSKDFYFDEFDTPQDIDVNEPGISEATKTEREGNLQIYRETIHAWVVTQIYLMTTYGGAEVTKISFDDPD